LLNEEITYATVMKSSGVGAGVASAYQKVLIC